MILRFILNLTAFFVCFQLTGQLRTFRNFNHRTGLNYGTINCLNQSEDGLLWLGTDGGQLVKYDGEEFEEVFIGKLNNNHHFSSIFIRKDDIYFSSLYNGFYRFDRSQRKLFQYSSDEQSTGTPLKIVALEDYTYLISSKAFQIARGDSIVSYLSLAAPIIEVHQVIVGDKIAVVTTNGYNYVLKDGKVIRLSEWLKNSQSNFNELKFGYINNDQIHLYDKGFKRKLEIDLSKDGEIFSKKESDLPATFNQGEFAISASFGNKLNTLGILTNKGSVYQLAGNRISPITHNYSSPLVHTTSIFTDYNNDFWVTSTLKGVYKISREAFTQIQLHPVYAQPNIVFIHKTVFGDVIISTTDQKTFVGNIYFNTDFKEYDIRIYDITEIDDELIISSNTGLQKFTGGENSMFVPYLFTGESTMLVFSDDRELYVNVLNRGLIRVDPSTGKEIQVPNEKYKGLSHFYTAQKGWDENTILFGTNDGIYKYYKKENRLSKVKTDKLLGSYCGLSTTDRYGTKWFTLNNGIVGFTKSGHLVNIHDYEILRTNLLYTLNSDEYGNLIVGTNKGIILIKVDENGKIRKHQYFDKDSGFDGYETNMRAQYKDAEQGIIYVGTVEGLFSINTSLIEESDVPIAPTVKVMSGTGEEDTIRSGSRQFRFHVNNAKVEIYSYRYRIRGFQDQWKTITSSNTILVDNLSNGEYTIEVAASFDGMNYGPIGTGHFIVDLPIWKSNWFIIFVLVLIVLVNLILINQNKSFKANRILDTKDIVINTRMTPSILLFGVIAVILTHIFAPLIDDTLELHLGITLIVTFAMCVLYYLSIQSRENQTEKYNQYYLMIGLIIITSHLFYELFVTKLHPYYLVGIVLVSVIAPYILSKIKHLVMYSLGILVLSILFVVVLNNTVYPKVYFMTAIIILICLSIIVSYLRLDSLEKLLFISGIVNKGNFPAIAFDRNGIVTYVSENISRFIDITHDELLNKNISYLNKFIPYEGEFKEIDVTGEFNDGEKYIVPMKDVNGDVSWIEWSYKDFSRDVKVILGQDISEKLELENTYELLVQSAEDFIYRCNMEGEFTFLNDVCYEKLGYSKSELLNKPASVIIADEYRDEVFSFYMEELQKDVKSSYKEFPIISKNGTEIWVGQYITKTFAAGSDIPNGFIAVARDITNKRETEHLIHEQKENITSSINYAKRIQERLLPHIRKFKSNFDDHFILYKPKDIVSGDFYWYEKLDKKHIIALGDCTGHGVPGSFMTILGMNLLNSIIKERQLTDPGKILNLLNEKLIAILSNDGETAVMDGMEIVICIIEEGSDQMSFACAGGRFLIYQKDGFSMYKGDNQHIGDQTTPDFTGYRTHFTEFTEDDQLFLFTDGFQDQFGGEHDKKFYFRNLIELYEANIDLPLEEQKREIEFAFDSWKGDTEQTDDVTVVSLKKHNL